MHCITVKFLIYSLAYCVLLRIFFQKHLHDELENLNHMHYNHSITHRIVFATLTLLPDIGVSVYDVDSLFVFKNRNPDAVYEQNSAALNGCYDTVNNSEFSLKNGQPILQGQENCAKTVENTYL